MEQENRRIEVIDAIRGFALMGLFLVHMVEYFELYWYAPEPGWVHDLIFGLFAGKAFALFALMFGVSFYILLEAPASNASLSRSRYAWRMLLLWGIGYVHSLIYAGDILQVLAVGGLVILALHRLPDKILITLAGIFLLQIPFFIQYALILPDVTYTQPRFWGAFGGNFDVFANANLVRLLEHNIWQGQFPKWILNYETGALWNFLGLFFTGIVLARRHLFGGTLSNTPYLIAAGILGVLAFLVMKLRNHYATDLEPLMHKWVFEEGLSRIYNFCIVGLYLTLSIVLYRFNVGRYVLKPLVACGRASLSLYVLQSLVFVPMFYGFGLDWHESIGQPTALALGIVAWVVQVVLANLWLAYFRYAPLEALWRHLTRLKSNQNRDFQAPGNSARTPAPTVGNTD